MSLKIENAAYVVTVDAERRVIADASLLIDGQRITHVGKADELHNIAADRTIDARGCVVLPAFVNGHMHISYAHAVRGNFPDDFVGRERLREVFRLQSAMREEEEYWTSLLAIIELLKSGTVTFVEPGSTQFVDACLQAYADSGARVISGAGVVDRESDLALPYFATAEALTRTADFIRAYDGRLDGRLRAWAMPFSPDTCSAELLSGARRIAEDNGTWMTIHHVGGPTPSWIALGRLVATCCCRTRQVFLTTRWS